MNKEVFDQIINLIQNTGDTFIIFDEKRNNPSTSLNKGEAYAVMNFKNYQKLVLSKKENSGNKDFGVNLTEFELLDKINKEINLWKASQEQKASEVELPE